MKKIIAIILMFTMLLALFAGCGSVDRGYGVVHSTDIYSESAAPAPAAQAPAAGINSRTNIKGAGMAAEAEMGMADEAAMQPPTAPPTGGDGGIAGPAVTPVIDSRKIIRNVSMQVQTLAFDRAVDDISRIAESFGGYVQDSYVEGRDMYNERGTRAANFTVRIPSEKLDGFVNSFGGEDFNVISKSQNSEDVTESYFDSKARLDALKVQEERLMAMLEQATELEYLLQVEKELMNVRYEIESLNSSLKRLDSYVSLSTVNIYLSEVVKYEPVENVPITFGERISRAFTYSWESFADFSQNFTVGLISVLPFLLLILVIVLILLLIIRRGKKRAIRKTNPSGQNIPVYAATGDNPAPASVPDEAAPADENKK